MIWFNKLSVALLVLALAGNVVRAEDAVEGEDGDVNVEGPEADESEEFKGAKDVDVHVYFTKPVGNGFELPAGKDVRFLVGFKNNGDKDFNVEALDASIKYSQDFTYTLQNFSAIGYNKIVKPKQEVTLGYQFFLSEVYAPRPYGLTVNLYYRDAERAYNHAVFNETITVVELEEGFVKENVFLFFTLAGLAAAAAFGLYTYFVDPKKSITGPRAKVETGTANHDIDYDWIPKDTLKNMKQSPAATKQSPRQKRAKKD